MIAYYGQINFDGIGHGRFERLVRSSFHSPLHASDWVVAEGSGKMLLADRAFDVNSFDLEDGNLTIRSGNLLAYEPTMALKQSIVPGFVTLIGTGSSWPRRTVLWSSWSRRCGSIRRHWWAGPTAPRRATTTTTGT